VDIEQNDIAFEKLSAVDYFNLSFLPNSICYFLYDGCCCINILLLHALLHLIHFFRLLNFNTDNFSIQQSVAYDRSSAPNDCRIFLNGDSAIDIEKMYLLSEFTYDLEKSNAQTFNVLNSSAFGLINTVRLDFTSNHGSPSHTSIFRVHGHEPDSVSMMAVES